MLLQYLVIAAFLSLLTNDDELRFAIVFFKKRKFLLAKLGIQQQITTNLANTFVFFVGGVLLKKCQSLNIMVEKNMPHKSYLKLQAFAGFAVKQFEGSVKQMNINEPILQVTSTKKTTNFIKKKQHLGCGIWDEGNLSCPDPLGPQEITQTNTDHLGFFLRLQEGRSQRM